MNRYNMKYICLGHKMQEEPDGEWVKHEDAQVEITRLHDELFNLSVRVLEVKNALAKVDLRRWEEPNE